MNILKCFETLELDYKASLAEVREAYIDLVNVWHPDRFIQNPRLRQKAENKLRNINTAYEKLTAHLSNDQKVRFGPKDGHSSKKTRAGEDKGAKFKQESDHGTARPQSRSKTEVAVEIGTRATLTVCYSLYKALQAIAADLSSKAEQDSLSEQQHAPNKR